MVSPQSTNTSASPVTPETARMLLARRSAWIAGLFCGLLIVLLTFSYLEGLQYDPLESKELAALKADLVAKPMDSALKQKIRDLDLTLRQHHATYQARASLGGWMLLAGGIIFLASLKTAMYRKKLNRPEQGPPTVEQANFRARHTQWATVVLALLISGWILSTIRSSTTLLSAESAKPPVQEEDAPTAVAMPSTPFPTLDEIERNWPRFRGPYGSGVSRFTNILTTWNTQTGEGIAWKTAIPLFGPNSPVVWENRVFLTGSSAKNREVFCFDATNGKLLWRGPVETQQSPAEPPTVMEDSGGYSASTAATDGRRVYAIFANGDVAAFDYQGTRVWARSLGKPDNSYGHATSLELYQNRLLIQFDQGSGKDNKSKLLALDTATGQTAWESQPRPVANSWSSPLFIEAAQKPQVITCANPWVISYNPTDGTEIWRAQALYGEVTPSPIYSGGMIFTVMEGEALCAIRPDGSGDVTKTHIAWKAEDGLPDICSPLADGQRIYLLTSHGTLTCYELTSGKKLWEHELDLTLNASPSLVGDRLWLFSVEGQVIQVAAANEFKELGRFAMGEEVLASPAFAEGRAFIRTKNHLFCIAKK
ncbi:MAG TPA: PQQ-binding-like beta-propeller repeat protein [Candidatus Paceibacterota bacterium]|nr:PQQ-binding-like beta-propeller repeat protein [Verrucomicrobiota bacterium]HRY48516.1 PQQ-binding-like beta-propeller repeat protein [Candidatus Paceibacterota bacterium]